MNGFERDRFEMLSAYLDGEATAQERQQVQHWLDTDPEAQKLYRRLSQLRCGMKEMPIPRAQPTHQLTQGVFQRLRRRRWKQAAFVGSGAIAAVFVGMMSGIVPGSNSGWQYAETQPQSSPEMAITEDTLTIAINRPVVAIPKAAIAPPEKLP